MTTSKLQKRVSELLSIHFGNYTIRENNRPDWLVLEGSRLELDFIIEELNCAIEVNGLQHYEYVPFFYSSPDDFAVRLKRDKFKSITCANKGIYLYTICSEMDAILAVKSILAKVDLTVPDIQPVQIIPITQPGWFKKAGQYNKLIVSALKKNSKDRAVKYHNKLRILLKRHDMEYMLEPLKI